VPVAATGSREFRVEIPLHVLVGRRLTTHDDWDLWLTARPDAEPLRLARLLDDVLEKKQPYNYPGAQVLDEYHRPGLGIPGEDEGAYELDAPASEIIVKPFFTPSNELSVYVNERSA
jgi:hypothetical protein